MADILSAPEIWRIYTKPDGTSAMERVDLSMNAGAACTTRW